MNAESPRLEPGATHPARDEQSVPLLCDNGGPR
jgi:hypothetical protein